MTPAPQSAQRARWQRLLLAITLALSLLILALLDATKPLHEDSHEAR